jgi:hypothetical protein
MTGVSIGTIITEDEGSMADKGYTNAHNGEVQDPGGR